VRILLAAVLVLVAGCAAAPEPGRGDAAVLFADERRGMGPASDQYDAPDFVLYADGRAIVAEPGDDDVPRLVEYHLTPERVRVLFEEADDAGLFDDADYALDEQVPDAGSLVIVARTAEREHVAKIVLPSPDDSGARGDAAAFAGSLRPSDWADDDFTAPPTPYRPGRVAVVYEVVTDPTEAPRPWPLTEQEPVEPGCAVLTGAAATHAQELGETEQPGVLWQHGDVTFRVKVRPLLPDEADCPAAERRLDR
jgi:hypothetical protein